MIEYLTIQSNDAGIMFLLKEFKVDSSSPKLVYGIPMLQEKTIKPGLYA